MPISFRDTRRRLRGAAVLLAAAALLGACDDTGAPDPRPGELVVRMETPNIDRAVLFEIRGPEPIGGVSPAPGRTVFGGSGSTTIRAAVFGAALNGELMRVAVPDVHKARAYSITLLEASGIDNTLRTSLSGYRVTISAAR